MLILRWSRKSWIKIPSFKNSPERRMQSDVKRGQGPSFIYGYMEAGLHRHDSCIREMFESKNIEKYLYTPNNTFPSSLKQSMATVLTFQSIHNLLLSFCLQLHLLTLEKFEVAQLIKIRPLDTILKHTNPDLILTHYFCKIHFNITLSSTHQSSKWSHPVRFSD